MRSLHFRFSLLKSFEGADNLQLQIAQISSIIIFGLAIAYVVLGLFVPTNTSQWMAILCIVFLSGLAVFQSYRQNQRLASIIIVITGWAAVTGAELGLDWTGAYISDVSLFLLIIIFATVMLGGRGGLLTVIFSSAVVLVSSLMNSHVFIQDQNLMMRLEWTHWVERTILFLTTMLFVRLLMNRLMGVVTRLRTSEFALKQQSEHLQQALRAGQMRTWDWDLKTGIIHSHNLGGSHSLLDKPYIASELFQRIYPDDVSLIREHLDKCIATDEPFQMEFRVKQPAGGLRWLMVSGGRYSNEQGAVICLSGVSQDITDRKIAQQTIRRSEERFFKAFHANPIPIAITTPDVSRTYIDVNQSWGTLFGYKPHELIGQSSLKVDTWVNPDDPQRVRDTYESQGSVRDMELWRKARDGREMLVQMTIEMIDMLGEDYWLVMLRDVTEHKVVSEQALELALVRERINVLRDFLSTMSHDLKTPLTVMNTSLDLMERIQDAERRHEKADIIRSQVTLVNRYIQDTLTIARLDYSPQITLEKVNFSSLVEMLHQRLLTRMDDKNLTFINDIVADLPDLHGDPAELERAFLNLIENAINYTPSGGRIVVRASQEGPMAYIEVQDTGIGIAPKEHGLVFERFYRTSVGKQTHQNGTGLGLAIVKCIVEMHGGKIDLESTPGEGTVFHLRLPMVSSGDEEETQPSAAPVHSLPLLDADTGN